MTSNRKADELIPTGASVSGTGLRTLQDVHALLRDADPEGLLVPCEIRDIRLGPDAAEAVVDAVAECLPVDADPAMAEVVMLVDETVIRRGADDLKAMVEEQLRARFRVRREVLSDGHSELHVTEPVVETATRAVVGAAVVVAVGGGTISDIAKLATGPSGQQGLVVVQTAASVDGFTDNVSVLLRGGVKRTVPSRWPDLVIADAQVIAAAPAEMNRAGYGEMTSLFVAPADWRLAGLVGLDQSFARGPIAILEVVGRDIDEWSAGIGRADPAAVERLTWALDVRGIATGVAGTTACLSGVEHLISHMLDLHHVARQLPMGLHGAQVGVAAVVAAAAWEMCMERLSAGSPGVEVGALDPTTAHARVEAAFSEVDPTGRIAAECWNDYSRKLAACGENLARIEDVLRRWPDQESELRALLRPASHLGSGLRAASAAATFGELEPSIGPDLANWAVQNCHLMRNRFTVVDLLNLLGWWTPNDVVEVLQRASDAVSAPGRTDVGHVG